MKKCLPILSVILIVALSCHQNNNATNNPSGSDTFGLLMNTDENAAKNLAVNDQTFYETLKPYGRWTSIGSYKNVWIPNEGRSFRPYANHGHWLYSDAGWVWKSDYRWGWAPFHYGRWFYDGNEGWAWVPGTEWAPAWVTWSHCNGYYGWAPLAPGISIDISIGRGWNAPREYWNFVPEREFVSYRPYDRVIDVYSDPTIVNSFYGQLTIVNNRPERNIYSNYVYNAGPRIVDVERVTHQRVTPVILRESASPVEDVSNRQMNIYSPAINNYVQRNKNVRQQNNQNVVVSHPWRNDQQQVNNQIQNRQQPNQNIIQHNNGNKHLMEQQENRSAFAPLNKKQLRAENNNHSIVAVPNATTERNFNHGRQVEQMKHQNIPANNNFNHPTPHQERNVMKQEHAIIQQQRHEQRMTTPQVQSRPQVERHEFKQSHHVEQHMQVNQPMQQVPHENPHQVQMQGRPQENVHQQNHQMPQRKEQPQNNPAPQNHPAPQMNPRQQNNPPQQKHEDKGGGGGKHH